MTRNEALAALAKWESEGFEWGLTDCCQFVDFIQSQRTGDYRIPWEYDSEYEANMIVDQFGTLQQTVTHVLGEPVEAVLTQIGDPVLWVHHKQIGLGVNLGLSEVAVVLQKSGRIGRIGIEKCVAGWKL